MKFFRVFLSLSSMRWRINKMVAFLTEADPIQRILIYIGEPATPPRIAPARGTPGLAGSGF